jgi:hypothetical protein
VAVDSALPGVKHLTVVVLFGLNASLVLQLSQFRGSLLVHHFLKLASHCAVPLANLSQHVCLVHLLHHAGLHHLLLVGLVLTVNFGFHVVALVLLHPLLLRLKVLLELDVLLSISVHVPQKVNAGLVFTVPLLLAGLPLLGVLVGNQLVDHLLVSLLVKVHLRGKLLEFDSLGTVAHTFVVLNLLESFLAFEGRVQKLQVSLLLREFGLLSQELLLLVVLDEAEVTFTDEDLALFLSSLLSFSFSNPLGLEHLTFNRCQLFALGEYGFLRLLLPVEDGKGISVELLFFLGLSDFTLDFLLCVKRVELGVDLFFEHALLDLTALVNQLLLAFDLSSHNVEFRIFLAECVVAHFELLVKFALDESLTLLFTITLKLLKTFVHVLADLLGSLLLVVELLFVHAVLSGEE